MAKFKQSSLRNILKTIYKFPNAVELIDFLEDSLLSDDFLFANNALLVIYEHKIKVSDSSLLSAVDMHLSKLYTALLALNTIDVSEDNYAKLMSFFSKAQQCCQKEFIGEVLVNKYLPTKSKELFDLFGCDKFAKIRVKAVKIAKEYDYDLLDFSLDADGHVRKCVDEIIS